MKLDHARYTMDGAIEPQVRFDAATELPVQPPPTKVKPGTQSQPSFFTTAKPNPGSALRIDERAAINKDLTTLRNGQSTRAIIRDWVKHSPDVSAAVTAYVRLAITDGHVAFARNPDTTFNREATIALHQIITRMTVVNDYTIGFDDAPSLREAAETLATQVILTGSMACELVLDKARLPYKLQPIAVSQIQWFPSTDGKRIVPKQVVSGSTIDLNIPTFFMERLDMDPLSAYTDSMLETALQPMLMLQDFMNDIRRVVKKAIHPRQIVTLVTEEFKKTVPEDAQFDSVKMAAFMNGVIERTRAQVATLRPEDALVLFDSMQYEVKDHGNTNLSNEYKAILDLMFSKMATGVKAMPAVLGHGGSANTASAEVLLFMKMVEGTVWAKLNEMFSKIFTLAVRLLGHDVVIEFKFRPIDLRPEMELESFKAMKQSRILDLLSLGFVADEIAGLELTGQLPPASFAPLSGAMFRAGAGTIEPAGDGYNGAANKGSNFNKQTASDAPKNAKSQNKGQPGRSAEVVQLHQE